MLQGWIICRQILFPGFAACCGPDGLRASRAWWFFTFNHISLPKTPPVPRVWWQKHRASPGCSPASKETSRSGVHTSQAFLKLPFLCSKRELGWRLSHQCPHRSCHLPHQTLHPKFGTAGMGRSEHVKGPKGESCRERLHPGRQTAQGRGVPQLRGHVAQGAGGTSPSPNIQICLLGMAWEEFLGTGVLTVGRCQVFD